MTAMFLNIQTVMQYRVGRRNGRCLYLASAQPTGRLRGQVEQSEGSQEAGGEQGKQDWELQPESKTYVGSSR